MTEKMNKSKYFWPNLTRSFCILSSYYQFVEYFITVGIQLYLDTDAVRCFISFKPALADNCMLFLLLHFKMQEHVQRCLFNNI